MRMSAWNSTSSHTAWRRLLAFGAVVGLGVGLTVAGGGAGPAAAAAAAAPSTVGPSEFKYTALPTHFYPRQVQDDGTAVGRLTDINDDAVWRAGALSALKDPVPAGDYVDASDIASFVNAAGVVAGSRFFFTNNGQFSHPDGGVGATWMPSGYGSDPTTFTLATHSFQDEYGQTAVAVDQIVGGQNDFGQIVLNPYQRAATSPEITDTGGAHPRSVPGLASIASFGNTLFVGLTATGVATLQSVGTLAPIAVDFSPAAVSPSGWAVGVMPDGTEVVRSPSGSETTVDATRASAVDDRGDVLFAAGSGSAFGWYYTPFGGSRVPVSSLLPADTAGSVQQPTLSANGVIAGYLQILTGSESDAGHGFELLPGAGQITVSGISLNPPHPTVNAGTTTAPVTATVTVRNDYSTTVTSVVPTLTSSDPATLTVTSGPSPARVASLAAGDTASFTYTLTPNKPQSATLSATATATSDSGATVTTPKPDTLLVDLSPGDLTIALAADPAAPTIADTIDIAATLTNKTDLTLTALTPSLTAAPADSVTIGTPTPLTIASLAPHASTAVHWSMTATKPAAETLTATVTLTDPDTGPQTDTATTTLTVTGPNLIVTTSGDQDDPPAALQHEICDVDPNTTGDQCTLRAAIELADQLGGAQKITFAIPGSSVPTITPGTDLPATTGQLTVDGTTQPGGRVLLSGASDPSGTGLHLSGGASTVTGLVISGWATGLLADGAGHDTITGDRIGTDPTGTAAVPNNTGLRLLAPQSLVGRTTGGNHSVCDGGCNVISGNSSADIDLSPSNGAAAGGSEIVGNVIGPDVTGRHVLGTTVSGITFGLSGALVWPAGTAPVTIGGTTSRPGVAPGNLIAGQTSFAVGSSITPASPGDDVAVGRGNLIGATWDDDAALATDRGIAMNGVTSTWGGPADGDANDVVFTQNGFDDTGGMTYSVRNLIGIGITGVPQGNQIGLEGEVTTCGSTISGNQTGIHDHGTLEGGNRIGTDSTGTVAVANRVGMDVINVFSAQPEGPCVGISTDPDLISGNTDAGIEILGAAFLGHVFIGTDITGHTAIANGIGIMRSPNYPNDYYQLALGTNNVLGKSTCGYPCVLISGNHRGGVVLPASDSSTQIGIVNTGIGVTVDGQPLPNDGPGLSFAGQIGDTPIQGTGSADQPSGIVSSRIAFNHGPGIDLSKTAVASDTDRFPIDHDTVDHNSGAGLTLGDGHDVAVSHTAVDDNTAAAVTVTAGAAPDLLGNTMTGNQTGYTPGPAGGPVTAPAAPARIAATASASGLTVAGDIVGARPRHARIDVYGDTTCTTSSQGAVALSSTTLPLGAASEFTVTTPPTTARGVEVTITDLDSSTSLDAAATGSTSAYSTCSTVTGNGNAAGSLSTTTAAPGDTVTATGTGFTPGEPVQGTLHSIPVDLGAHPADTHGTVTVTFTVPTDITPGQHHVLLVGQQSGLHVDLPLTITAAPPSPTPTNPTPGSSNPGSSQGQGGPAPAGAAGAAGLADTGVHDLGRMLLLAAAMIALGAAVTFSTTRRPPAPAPHRGH